VIPSTQIPISVDKPNWEPLERVLPLRECSDFIYMGHAGEIELYSTMSHAGYDPCAG
jgi:hypothetical protein